MSPGSCPSGPQLSSGPAAGLVTVAATAVQAIGTDRVLAVTSQLLVGTDGPRIVLNPTRSSLQLRRDGVVVATAAGVPGADVPLQLRAGAVRDAQVVPTQLPLRDCAGQPVEAGSYTLVVVVGYGGDPLNAGAAGAGGSFALVSTPVPVTVR